MYIGKKLLSQVHKASARFFSTIVFIVMDSTVWARMKAARQFCSQPDNRQQTQWSVRQHGQFYLPIHKSYHLHFIKCTSMYNSTIFCIFPVQNVLFCNVFKDHAILIPLQDLWRCCSIEFETIRRWATDWQQHRMHPSLWIVKPASERKTTIQTFSSIAVFNKTYKQEESWYL